MTTVGGEAVWLAWRAWARAVEDMKRPLKVLLLARWARWLDDRPVW